MSALCFRTLTTESASCAAIYLSGAIPSSMLGYTLNDRDIGRNTVKKFRIVC